MNLSPLCLVGRFNACVRKEQDDETKRLVEDLLWTVKTFKMLWSRQERKAAKAAR